MIGTLVQLARRNALLWSVCFLFLLTGCAGHGNSIAPRATPETSITGVPSGLRADVAILQRRSLSPDYHVVVPLADGSSLIVFHSICAGSADGHCHAVDVFHGSSEIVWQRQYADVLRLSSADNGFLVRSAHYRPNDPLCCPSGGESTQEFMWSDGRIVPAPTT